MSVYMILPITGILFGYILGSEIERFRHKVSSLAYLAQEIVKAVNPPEGNEENA